jgi:VanZ family protein
MALWLAKQKIISMQPIPIRKFLPGIAWFFIVLLLICLPGDDLPKPDSWMKTVALEKWVHAGMFGILAIFFIWPVAKSGARKLKWKYIFRICVLTCTWGLATEFIQKWFITGRTFDLTDWLADSLGVLIAWIYARTKLL